MRIVVLALFLGSVVPLPALADEPAVPAEVAQADSCLKRLETSIDKLTVLEKTARLTGQAGRADCLIDHHERLVGLREIIKGARARLPDLARANDAHGVAVQAAAISAACNLAEALDADAVTCSSLPAGAKESLPPPPPPTNSPSRPPLDNTATGLRVPADEPGCLRQQDLACLLFQALELAGRLPPLPAQCVAALVQRHIVPLTGWHPEQCTTLAEFGVVVAAALQLEVPGNHDEPAAYLQALRDAGLPVDALLPAQAAGEPPPVITAADAETFFACGYGIPHREARPVPPPPAPVPLPSFDTTAP